jgi:YHS domain-containing protein
MKYIFLVLSVASLTYVQAQNHSKKTEKSKANTTISNKQDPICQMAVNNNSKDTVHYKGKVMGFCSSHCKTEFKKNPKKYSNSK